MGLFSSQEYWSRLPFPTPGDVPDTGIGCISFVSPALAGRFFTTEPPGKPQQWNSTLLNNQWVTEETTKENRKTIWNKWKQQYHVLQLKGCSESSLAVNSYISNQ